ncbi:DUF1566 domain-containing protein [Anaerolineales bacterium HSG6]|nr:DUF1566 domain-containing protein [Anaerolineales bacterium HSG6]
MVIKQLLTLTMVTLLCLACGSQTVPPDQSPAGHVSTPATSPQPDTAVASATQRPTDTNHRSYAVVDTGQNGCYNATDQINCPASGTAFYGQDANYAGLPHHYQNNGDGTITDLNTGLMWQKTPNLDDKSTYAEAVAGADSFNLAGYDDWRLPTIKEHYSLTHFNGSSMREIPYIDTNYFDFRFGSGWSERTIDAQYWSSTEYVGTTFHGDATVFGMNFADGRIKGYPRDKGPGGSPMTEFVRYVRGNPDYGINQFVDNGNDTITDEATGLIWQKGDSGRPMNWEAALLYCETLHQAGHEDWRLPNAKELQTIVDYSRAPDALNLEQQGPAIDPIFNLTETESWYWTGTTLFESPPHLGQGNQAVYFAFGQAFGVYDDGLLNVHGAGAQRGDPKSGNPADWTDGLGPQNDQIRINNYARCIRAGQVTVAENLQAAPDVQQPQTQPQQPSDRSHRGSESLRDQQGQPPQGRTPPQEALDACHGLSDGATCEFNAPHGRITGTCRIVPQQQLACVP